MVSGPREAVTIKAMEVRDKFKVVVLIKLWKLIKHFIAGSRRC
jgi:hypothetical protein